MTNVLREAMREDIPAILQLYAQPDMDDGKVLPVRQAEDIFLRMQSYPGYTLYVAVQGEEIVGTFALAVMDTLAHQGAPSGLVEDVVVKVGRLREGIGRQMMAYAVERCRQYGCYKLALSSNAKRVNAHRFYETLGFERHGYSFTVPIE